jgi:hypothetical protein
MIGIVVGGLVNVTTGGVEIRGGLSVYSGGVHFDSTPRSIHSADRRLTTDIAPLSGSLSKISKLRGVYFKWMKDEISGLQFDDDRHIGVLAQDVQKVLPEIVHQAHDSKYLSVDYTSLIPLLIEAIRELNLKTTMDHTDIFELVQELVNDMKEREKTLMDHETKLAAMSLQLESREAVLNDHETKLADMMAQMKLIQEEQQRLRKTAVV